MIRSLRFASALAAALAFTSLASGPAAACIGPAPPDWDALLTPTGPAMFVGRVAAVALAPTPRVEGAVSYTDAVATIQSMSVVQGDPTTEVAVPFVDDMTYDVLTAGPVCPLYLHLSLGDMVLVYDEPGDGSRVIPEAAVDRPELMAVFAGLHSDNAAPASPTAAPTPMNEPN